MAEERDPPSAPSGPAAPGLDRRDVLGAGAATLLAAFTARGLEAQDLAKSQAVQQGASANDPGPENTEIRNVNPNTFLPPVTDHGEVQTFWNTFSGAHRRIQEGGWSRQVTVEDFPISKDIAGVNMRLTAGGIRELHWHNAAEWALMLTGKARITAIDNDGRSAVKDVGINDLWFFPTGTPHSIQGLAPDGCEFLLVFDDGKFSEGNTTLISDWTRHTPPEVLAKNWGVPEASLSGVYKALPMAGISFRCRPGISADDTNARRWGARVRRPWFSISPCIPWSRRQNEIGRSASDRR